MKKQTAVEWLEECIKIGLTYEQEVSFEGLFQQALEMEKEQMIDAFMEGADFGEMFNNEGRGFITDAEQYYNNNYKSE